MAAPASENDVIRPSDDKEMKEILANLADPVKTSSQTTFKREFGLLKSRSLSPGMWAYISEMTPVIQRCCQEKKFWPAAELEYLIVQQWISPRNIQMVFETLSAKNEVGLMYKALSNQLGKDIPETCMVMALQCFLSAEEKILQLAMDQCQPPVSTRCIEDESCPFSKTRSAFIDQVLYASYDEVYLVSSLKKLPFGLVLNLLNYLLFRMKTEALDQAHIDQLSKWKGHIINAHSTELVISKDGHELLIQFNKEEELNKRFVTLANEDLMPLLKLAVTRNTDKGSRATGQYCIETLHL